MLFHLCKQPPGQLLRIAALAAWLLTWTKSVPADPASRFPYCEVMLLEYVVDLDTVKTPTTSMAPEHSRTRSVGQQRRSDELTRTESIPGVTSANDSSPLGDRLDLTSIATSQAEAAAQPASAADDDQLLRPAGCQQHISRTSLVSVGDPAPSVLFPATGPTWLIQADSLLLHRSGGDTRDSVLESTSPRNRSKVPEEFDDWGAGGRLRILRASNNGTWDWEAGFLQTDGWSRRFQVAGDHRVVGIDMGRGRSRLRYESDLSSLNLDVKKYLTNWTQVTIGFRWMQLDESARARGQGTLFGAIDRTLDVQNQLIGGQLGLDHTLWDRGGNVTIDVATRLGLLANQIDRHSDPAMAAAMRAEATSLLGELELAGTYYLWSNTVFTFGYHLMAISDVALAIDQFAFPGAVHDSSELFVHGFRAGLGLNW